MTCYDIYDIFPSRKESDENSHNMFRNVGNVANPRDFIFSTPSCRLLLVLSEYKCQEAHA